MTTVDSADDVFLAHRDALFGLAYRMLGSISDAEDVVSESYLRWRRNRRDDVADPRAFLFAVTARLSIDLLTSARRTRVDYVGTWLPEPLVTAYDDPAGTVETKDTVSIGLLLLLERLSPAERAVFVLREAFDYPHAEVARLLELAEPNVRQLYRRARQRLHEAGAPRFIADRATQERLMQNFLAASRTGDVEPLARLLATDVVLYADGGGKASSVKRPIHGRLRVARFVRGLVRKSPPDLRIELVRANGAPAMLLRTSTGIEGVYELDVDPDAKLIRAIHAVRNPDKMQRLSA